MRKKYISPDSRVYYLKTHTILAGSETFNITDKDDLLWEAESKNENDNGPWGW